MSIKQISSHHGHDNGNDNDNDSDNEYLKRSLSKREQRLNDERHIDLLVKFINDFALDDSDLHMVFSDIQINKIKNSSAGLTNDYRYVFRNRLLQLINKKSIVYVFDFPLFEHFISITATTGRYSYIYNKKPEELEEYRELYSMFFSNPEKLLVNLRTAILSLIEKYDSIYSKIISDDFKVRIQGFLHNYKNIGDIDHNDVNKLVSNQNFVISVSDQKTLIKEMMFYCSGCGNRSSVSVKNNKYTPLKKCPICESTTDIHEDFDNSLTDTYIEVTIQEKPVKQESGSIAQQIILVCIGKDMLNSIKPGDFIELLSLVRIQSHNKDENAIKDYYLEAVYFEKKSDDILVDDDLNDPEIESKIKGLIRTGTSHEDEDYQKLVNAVASTIVGHSLIKEVMLLMIAGSDAGRYVDNTRHRGELNIGFFGDSGCLVAGTKVIASNGSMINIEELGDTHLQNINTKLLIGNGIKSDVATVFHKYEDKKVIELITETGKSIIGTYNHPLRVLNPHKSGNEYEWKQLQDMRVGDRLKVVSKVFSYIKNPVPTNFSINNVYKNNHKYTGNIPMYLDEKLASFMGYILGDGWVRKLGYRIGYCVSEKEVEILPKIIENGSIFNIEPKIEKRVFEKPVTTIMNDGRELTKSMTMNYVEYNSKGMVSMLSFLQQKQVPDLIFKSPDNIVGSFLKWLYQADGSVFHNGRGRNGIVLTSKHIKLLRDVQLLFLRFGIHSRIVTRPKNKTYNLSIRRGESIIKFARHIGFVDNNKNKILNELVRDAINFKRFKSQFTEKIVNIIYHTQPQTVYDVEVPKTHRFIANGIVSHNTAKTRLAEFIVQIFPRGRYIVGNTTPVGLTASMRFDKTTGKAILDAGAYLLASSDLGGIVVLDELDKVKEEIRETIAPCTDDRQRIEINKSNIHKSIQINCATMILANPKEGEVWDREKTIYENTGFKNWLLSRFLIWIFSDTEDEELDSIKAKHYLKQFDTVIREYEINNNAEESRIKGEYGSSTFKQNLIKSRYKDRDKDEIKQLSLSVNEWRVYCKYVRTHYHPSISRHKQVKEFLQKMYLKFRGNKGTKKITMRMLGDLVRLTEARARACFRNEVTMEDAKRAVEIVISSIASSGYNPYTNESDVPEGDGISVNGHAGASADNELVNSNIFKDVPEIKNFIGLDDDPRNMRFDITDVNRKLKRIVKSSNNYIISLDKIAEKENLKVHKEVAKTCKDYIRCLKAFACMKCDLCRGNGWTDRADRRCSSCNGNGYFLQPFSMNEIIDILTMNGSPQDRIASITKMLIDEGVITKHPSSSMWLAVPQSYAEFSALLASFETVNNAVERLKSFESRQQQQQQQQQHQQQQQQSTIQGQGVNIIKVKPDVKMETAFSQFTKQEKVKDGLEELGDKLKNLMGNRHFDEDDI